MEELNRSMNQLMMNQGAHASEGNLCLVDKSHVFCSAAVFEILIICYGVLIHLQQVLVFVIMIPNS